MDRDPRIAPVDEDGGNRPVTSMKYWILLAVVLLWTVVASWRGCGPEVGWSVPEAPGGVDRRFAGAGASPAGLGEGASSEARQAVLPPAQQGVVVDEPATRPQVPASVPADGHHQMVLAPKAAAERTLFIQAILAPHLQSTQAQTGPELSGKLTKTLRPDLTAAERREAESLVAQVVDKDGAYRAQLAIDLTRYVQEEPDLANPVVRASDGSRGVRGSVSHGIEPEWRRYWGNADAVTVDYWLPFRRYPLLGSLKDDVSEAKKRLLPYQVK